MQQSVIVFIHINITLQDLKKRNLKRNYWKFKKNSLMLINYFIKDIFSRICIKHARSMKKRGSDLL